MKKLGWILLAALLLVGCEPPAEHYDAKQTAKRMADKEWREGHTKRPTVKP